MSQVTARYPGTTTDVLRGLDLHLRAGEKVALVGPSGSGKSTVVRLLSRQLDPVAGSLTYDGQELSGCTRASVRDAVTVLLQETLLLDDTARENIRFARPDATDEEIEAAARAADAHDFLTALPEGYDGRIGQRGRALSGGQRQRLALARALLRRSPLIVLDEPTTGLDPAATRRLMTALVAGARERTVLILTHDPIALEYVDRVVALDTLDDPDAVAADDAEHAEHGAGAPPAHEGDVADDVADEPAPEPAPAGKEADR